MNAYQKKLLDPRWQRRRLEVLSLAEWECSDCGASEKTLHVHHPRYIKGREPWEYTDDELVVLCEDCHWAHTVANRRLIELVASNPYKIRQVVELVAGFLSVEYDDDFDLLGGSPPEDPCLLSAFAAGVVAHELYVVNPTASQKAISYMVETEDAFIRHPAIEWLLDLR